MKRKLLTGILVAIVVLALGILFMIYNHLARGYDDCVEEIKEAAKVVKYAGRSVLAGFALASLYLALVCVSGSGSWA